MKSLSSDQAGSGLVQVMILMGFLGFATSFMLARLNGGANSLIADRTIASRQVVATDLAQWATSPAAIRQSLRFERGLAGMSVSGAGIPSFSKLGPPSPYGWPMMPTSLKECLDPAGNTSGACADGVRHGLALLSPFADANGNAVLLAAPWVGVEAVAASVTGTAASPVPEPGETYRGAYYSSQGEPCPYTAAPSSCPLEAFAYYVGRCTGADVDTANPGKCLRYTTTEVHFLMRHRLVCASVPGSTTTSGAGTSTSGTSCAPVSLGGSGPDKVNVLLATKRSVQPSAPLTCMRVPRIQVLGDISTCSSATPDPFCTAVPSWTCCPDCLR